MRDGDDHAYLGFWSEDGTFSRWYINMEQHYRRTSIGIDFVDHFLDVVIDGNLTGWRWKDEDELAAAASTGLITRQAADAIRAEGRRAITRLEAHARPSAKAGSNGNRTRNGRSLNFPPTGRFRLGCLKIDDTAPYPGVCPPRLTKWR